jgi:multicomponent Na+:H+ antiporter subunit C
VTVLPYLVAAWLLLAGIWGVVTSRHLVHLVVCVSVTQAGTYVLLLAIGWRAGGTAPILGDLTAGGKKAPPVVDPVVQALTLTDVVVQATVAAVLLALGLQAHKRFRTADPDGLRAIRG